MPSSNNESYFHASPQETRFQAQSNRSSVSVYRVCLVKDQSLSFGNSKVGNANQAHTLIRHLILTRGQPDREHFVVAMLSTKNDLIGLNIVSVGALASTTVHPREVLKPAILANSASIILCHNHPSCDLDPSADDIAITRTLIRASESVGITVHDHLIISMENDSYFSFADQGLIAKFRSEIGRPTA